MIFKNPVLACICCFFMSGAMAQAKIEVFTDSPATINTVSGVNIIHFDLSESERLKSRALPALPNDEARAMKIIKAFFVSPEGEAFKNDMVIATLGQQKMIRYGLKKIPAVVFDDGRYVIYGTTDVAESMRLYQLHRQYEAVTPALQEEQ